jgi:hypothetical protein
MPALLMSLRDVPADEYAEISTLLDQHALEHYRTEPSRWGISHGALWLIDAQRLAEARELLAGYQRQRGETARAAWARARERGEIPTLFEAFLQRPLATTAKWLALLAMLALSVLPFLWLIGMFG